MNIFTAGVDVLVVTKGDRLRFLLKESELLFSKDVDAEVIYKCVKFLRKGGFEPVKVFL